MSQDYAMDRAMNVIVRAVSIAARRVIRNGC